MNYIKKYLWGGVGYYNDFSLQGLKIHAELEALYEAERKRQAEEERKRQEAERLARVERGANLYNKWYGTKYDSTGRWVKNKPGEVSVDYLDQNYLASNLVVKDIQNLYNSKSDPITLNGVTRYTYTYLPDEAVWNGDPNNVKTLTTYYYESTDPNNKYISGYGTDSKTNKSNHRVSGKKAYRKLEKQFGTYTPSIEVTSEKNGGNLNHKKLLIKRSLKKYKSPDGPLSLYSSDPHHGYGGDISYEDYKYKINHIGSNKWFNLKESQTKNPKGKGHYSLIVEPFNYFQPHYLRSRYNNGANLTEVKKSNGKYGWVDMNAGETPYYLTDTENENLNRYIAEHASKSLNSYNLDRQYPQFDNINDWSFGNLNSGDVNELRNKYNDTVAKYKEYLNKYNTESTNL